MQDSRSNNTLTNGGPLSGKDAKVKVPKKKRLRSPIFFLIFFYQYPVLVVLTSFVVCVLKRCQSTVYSNVEFKNRILFFNHLSPMYKKNK